MTQGVACVYVIFYLMGLKWPKYSDFFNILLGYGLVYLSATKVIVLNKDKFVPNTVLCLQFL